MSLEHTDEPRCDRFNWRVNDFCQAAGIGRTLFYDEVKRGEIQTIKIGSRTLIPDIEAKAWQLRKCGSLSSTGERNGRPSSAELDENFDAVPARLNIPPCARYEGGENNGRLIKVWLYVAGIVGGGPGADELSNKVARLFDYKGLLVVCTRDKLSTNVEAHFRNAWVEVGHEFEEHVEFADARSDRWERLWNGHRFESDWSPSSLSVAEPEALSVA